MYDEARMGKSHANDILRLYGIKALVTGLRDGGEAERSYLEGLAGSGSIRLADYARNMLGRLKQNIWQSGDA